MLFLSLFLYLVSDFEGFEVEKWDPAFAPIGHAAALTNKIRRRIFKLTLLKAQAAQRLCTDALDRMPLHPSGFVNIFSCISRSLP
jgi:hypothetical protein